MITILNTLAAFLIGLIIIYVKVKLQHFATKPLNQDQIKQIRHRSRREENSIDFLFIYDKNKST